jgi:hypothetical protein
MNKQPFGTKPIGDTGLIVTTLLMMTFTLLFLNLKLITLIKKEGIYVRFYPFHFRFKHYPWNELTQCEVITYDAIGDFGGWGIRMGSFEKGKAYNVSGNKGLQLEFKTKEKLLIGTNKADHLIKTLKQIEQLKVKEINS